MNIRPETDSRSPPKHLINKNKAVSPTLALLRLYCFICLFIWNAKSESVVQQWSCCQTHTNTAMKVFVAKSRSNFVSVTSSLSWAVINSRIRWELLPLLSQRQSFHCVYVLSALCWLSKAGFPVWFVLGVYMTGQLFYIIQYIIVALVDKTRYTSKMWHYNLWNCTKAVLVLVELSKAH